jgi:hypothetical protein
VGRRSLRSLDPPYFLDCSRIQFAVDVSADRRYIVVVYEQIDEDTVYPVTAYEVE